jgi:putative endonuclease
MAGLVPATHAFLSLPRRSKTWVPGTRPGMTHVVTCSGVARGNRDRNELVPATSVLFNHSMTAFVYMMTNRRNGVLYTGVTTNMPRRAYEHREGLIDGFTKRYGLKLLIYYESFDDVRDAIQREKNIKHWPRAWKVRLIHGFNPEWADLYESLF